MTDDELGNMEIFRKASRCATLYELLCEALGLNPLEPGTTWKDVAKGYSLIMEEAHKLQQPKKDENVND